MVDGSQRCLIVICGPPLAGKTTLAGRLGRQLPGKTAVIPQDELVERWIVQHDEDPEQERAWMYTQTRLLAANFLRNGYSVIVEGSYLTLRDGWAAAAFAEIPGLFRLMAALVTRSLLLVVQAPAERLQVRLAASGRQLSGAELRAAWTEYEQTGGLQGALRLDSSGLTVEQECERALLALGLASRS